MSETLNVNVLVAAKEEYTKQLVYILSPEIYKVLLNVFNDSQLLKKKMSVSLKNFQLQLKKIPTWNTIIIEKNTSDIKSKIPYLLDLITAIFVSHVKILACVRLKTDSKSINVKVPNLDVFLHKMIIMNAEKIYYNPDIILKKKEIVISLISDTIEETIRNQIPIDKILTEYLSGVFENKHDEDSHKNHQEDLAKLNEIEEDDEEDDEEEDEGDDEEDEEEDEEEGDEEGDDEEEKSIVPSRPLPPEQLPRTAEIPEEILGEKPEDKIPTTEIKNRVLFSDAIEKSVKQNTSNKPDNDEESDDESEIDFSDDDDE